MKRILIIPDEPHWALDKNAKDLVKYNKSDYQLDICYDMDFIRGWQKYYDNYDLLFPMYSGIFFSMLKNKIPVNKAVTGIRSYWEWDKVKTQPPGYNSKPSRKFIKKLKKAVLINTHCAKLWYIFIKFVPIIHTKYTCDLNIFFPENKAKNNKLVVGWAGNLLNHPNKRGFHKFIKSICDEISEIQLKVQTKDESQITDDNKMREFYNSLDLYICVSRSEGTPRPVLEASACAVPVIATDVGIVPELIDDGINGYIVEHDYESIKNRLLWIVKNREVLPEMGKNIRRKMEIEFDWEKLIFQWTDFFKYSLELIDLRSKGYLK